MRGCVWPVPADFYPRPPRGGRPPTRFSGSTALIFLSTPSARRATCTPNRIHRVGDISIHALREEGDTTFSTAPDSSMNFYPRPPRGGRPRRCRSGSYGIPISIHALREEGDTETKRGSTMTEQISIHALREEGDSTPKSTFTSSANFYPRPPRGGRPRPRRRRCWRRSNFYPRPPRGGRPAPKTTAPSGG